MSTDTLPEVGLGSRERLLASAAELIEAASYRSVPVQAICEHAGVNKGSFYHYFPSKRALVLAMIDEAWTQMTDQVLDPILTASIPIDEKIGRIYDCMYSAQVAHQEELGFATGCLFGSLAAEASTLEEPLRVRLLEVFEEWVGHMRKALQAALERGELPEHVDPTATAWILLAGLQGLLLLSKTADDPEVLGTSGDDFLRLVFDSVSV